MKTLEFDSPLDSRKKLMTVLFWTNRKAARTEGCASFLLKKIVTEEIDKKKPVKFEIVMGTESITAEIGDNTFCVSTEHSEEIENEIIEKLDDQLNKKFPSICESFKPRVTANK